MPSEHEAKALASSADLMPNPAKVPLTIESSTNRTFLPSNSRSRILSGHELHAVGLYKKLLEEVEDKSIYLEEYARGMIGEEEQHSLELKRMLKDYG